MLFKSGFYSAAVAVTILQYGRNASKNSSNIYKYWGVAKPVKAQDFDSCITLVQIQPSQP